MIYSRAHFQAQHTQGYYYPNLMRKMWVPVEPLIGIGRKETVFFFLHYFPFHHKSQTVVIVSIQVWRGREGFQFLCSEVYFAFFLLQPTLKPKILHPKATNELTERITHSCNVKRLSATSIISITFSTAAVTSSKH